jgi:hypothetical protein
MRRQCFGYSGRVLLSGPTSQNQNSCAGKDLCHGHDGLKNQNIIVIMAVQFKHRSGGSIDRSIGRAELQGKFFMAVEVVRD